MDVDSSSSSASFAAIAGGSATLPKIDENTAIETKPPRQKLIEFLDALETHVEKLRKDAIKLEEDKDSLLASLDSLRNADLMLHLEEVEKEDIIYYADRITTRCHTIELKIHTQRDHPQEEALHQINLLIDSLVMSMKHDPFSTKAKCIAYMNACSSHFVDGATDKNFESVLLGCTLDDQKRVKKRLNGLLSYIENLTITSDDIE